MTSPTEVIKSDVDNYEDIAGVNQQGRKLIADHVSGVYFDDVRAPVTAINPPGLASDPTFNTTEGYFEFADAATNLLFITLQLPHNYMEGSNIYPHVHWVQTAAGLPLWRLDYKWFNNGVTYPAAFTQIDIVDSVFTYTSGNLVQISRFPLIVGTNKNISSILQLQLSRIGGDASDTLNGATANLLEFDIHYAIDSHGSQRQFRKIA